MIVKIFLSFALLAALSACILTPETTAKSSASENNQNKFADLLSKVVAQKCYTGFEDEEAQAIVQESEKACTAEEVGGLLERYELVLEECGKGLKDKGIMDRVLPLWAKFKPLSTKCNDIFKINHQKFAASLKKLLAQQCYSDLTEESVNKMINGSNGQVCSGYDIGRVGKYYEVALEECGKGLKDHKLVQQMKILFPKIGISPLCHSAIFAK